MIRPESVELVKEEHYSTSDNFNYLNGRVAYINYTGVSYLIGVIIEGSNDEFLIRIQNASEDINYSEEELVRIKWPIKETLVYS